MHFYFKLAAASLQNPTDHHRKDVRSRNVTIIGQFLFIEFHNNHHQQLKKCFTVIHLASVYFHTGISPSLYHFCSVSDSQASRSVALTWWVTNVGLRAVMRLLNRSQVYTSLQQLHCNFLLHPEHFYLRIDVTTSPCDILMAASVDITACFKVDAC